MLYLLLLLSALRAVFAAPIIDHEEAFAAPNAPLGRDLLSFLGDASNGRASSASNLPQQALKSLSDIDELAPFDEDSPVSKRAAAACRIAQQIFPGRVFAANDADYHDEQVINW